MTARVNAAGLFEKRCTWESASWCIQKLNYTGDAGARSTNASAVRRYCLCSTSLSGSLRCRQHYHPCRSAAHLASVGLEGVHNFFRYRKFTSRIPLITNHLWCHRIWISLAHSSSSSSISCIMWNLSRRRIPFFSVLRLLLYTPQLKSIRFVSTKEPPSWPPLPAVPRLVRCFSARVVGSFVSSVLRSPFASFIAPFSLAP